MAPDCRSEIVQLLEDSRVEFNAAAGGCPESQAKANPAPGCWSVLDCVEHVILVEERLMDRLERSARLDTPRVDKEREARIVSGLPNRSERLQAPEMVRPTGRYETLADALDQFNAVRTKTVQATQEWGSDLYSMTTEHPRFGAVNGAEMLMIVAGHARRHANQIRELIAG